EELITVDSRFIRLIVTQLLHNAIKFTNEGSVRCMIHVQKNLLVLEVHDSGIGISETILPTIFDPFMQISCGMGRGFEGAGLGLPIVKKLVELMDGTIQVSKNNDGGSTFQIQLPFVDDLSSISN